MGDGALIGRKHDLPSDAHRSWRRPHPDSSATGDGTRHHSELAGEAIPLRNCAVGGPECGDNASYYHPPVDRFDRIEVLKGSGQIAFGPQTIGGVINYITPRPPQDLGGEFTVEGGNRDYREVHGSVGDTIGNTG